MSLTLSEVNHIAKLARLDLSGEEKEQYRQQLSEILEYAARLQVVDTSSIPPTSSVLPPRSVLREDVASSSLDVDQILSNAPDAAGNQFRVPPVMD